MATEIYTNNAQMRGYQTLFALFGYEVAGVECVELAKQLERSKAQVYRDLTVMQQAGVAEQLPNKNWRIAPRFGLQAVKIMNAINYHRERVEEAAQRYGTKA